MNKPLPEPVVDSKIADVQGSSDNRNLTIDKVGVKDVRHPIIVKDRSGWEQHTVANFNMFVELPHNFKGTHMSRFIEILNQHERETTVQSFRSMLPEMIEHLDAHKGHIEMSFPFFLQKKAPVTGVESLLDYQVTLTGQVSQSTVTTEIRIVVPVTSLCPCSKEISNYGAHNQRSHVTVSVRSSAFIWIEELIETVETQASCELYGLLKRPDEKYVTEKAYDNPKFVEDLVRDIAGQLNQDQRINGYTVEAENFESIHNHSAYAQIHCERQD